ncbi:hypothetical protein LCGC14_2860840 [marine sediment metagenome]|uniref:Uncharacterized protein n=1 Tax=marine sediment metagenome TaxID=412755 RepID=A0A0F8YSE2_9ZZZZ
MSKDDTAKEALGTPMPVGSDEMRPVGRGLKPLSTIQMKLHVRRDDLERELKTVNEVITVLRTSPETERILLLITEAGVL